MRYSIHRGNPVDLNDIALFVQIVRAGSFAEAGRQLNIPPSTTSRRLQELERQLGTRLMHRSTRRLALTDAGRAFFTECSAQVDGLVQSARAVMDGSARPTGRVRVAAPADFFAWFTADHVARFLASHPLVQLEFELDDAQTDLLGRNIDVAFRGASSLEPGLVARQIAWSRTALVASPAYLLAHGTPQSPTDLTGHECITKPTRAGPPVTWCIGGPGGRVDVQVTGRFKANSMEAQLHGAAAGLGIALLPVTIAAAHLHAARLRQVLPDHTIDTLGFYVIFLSRRNVPRAVTTFVEFVANLIPQQTGMDPVSAQDGCRRTG